MKTIAIIGDPQYCGYAEEFRQYCFEKNLLPDCNIINTIDCLEFPVLSHWEMIKDAYGLIVIVPWSIYEIQKLPGNLHSAKMLDSGDFHFMIDCLVPVDIDNHLQNILRGNFDEHGNPVKMLPLMAKYRPVLHTGASNADEELYVARYRTRFTDMTSSDLRKAIDADMRLFPVFAEQTDFYPPRRKELLNFSNFLELEGRKWFQ